MSKKRDGAGVVGPRALLLLGFRVGPRVGLRVSQRVGPSFLRLYIGEFKT